MDKPGVAPIAWPAMKTPPLAVVVAFLSLWAGACASSNIQPPEPVKASPSTPATGTSEAAQSKTQPEEPVTVSCVPLPSSCSELTRPRAEAEEAKKRCLAAGGQPHDAACARDGRIGICEIASQRVTLFYYRDADSQMTKALQVSAPKACKNADGAWTDVK
jgi:hypothetical protein